MKTGPFFLALGILALNSCIAIDPGYGAYPQASGYRPVPDYREMPNRGQRYADEFGPRSHDKGLEMGRADGRAGRSDNYARHRGEYNERFETSVRSGYAEGYADGRRYYHPPGGRDDRYDRNRYDERGRDDRGRDNRHEQEYSDRNSRYYGGPAKWFESGENLGRRDRREGNSDNYRRHKNHYDGRTESEFARGYRAGYH